MAGASKLVGGAAVSCASTCASRATISRVSSFQPILTNPSASPAAVITVTTGFPLGRSDPTRTASSTVSAPKRRAQVAAEHQLGEVVRGVSS